MVVAFLIAALVNGVATASSLPAGATDDIAALATLFDGHANGDKDRSEGSGALDGERVEHVCCHAHQWLGSPVASRPTPDASLLERGFVLDTAWFGSEPAPILKPPSA